MNEWRSEVAPLRSSPAVPMRPERLCTEIQSALPPDAILVSDTGHSGIWSGTHIELHHPGQTYIRAAGSLGWGLPAAIGAKCAAPHRPVVCFTGDGGFYYHLSELETALRYGIHPVIVVNDNRSLNQETEIFASAYGGVQRQGLEMWQFRDLNIAAMAESLGCRGIRVEQPEAVAPALEGGLAGRPSGGAGCRHRHGGPGSRSLGVRKTDLCPPSEILPCWGWEPWVMASPRPLRWEAAGSGAMTSRQRYGGRWPAVSSTT